MAIEFECPVCGGTLQVGDETAGRVIRCGGCMTMLRVPGADAMPPVSGPSAPSAPASPFEIAPPAPRSRRPAPTPVQPPPDKPRRRRRNPDDPYDDRPRRSNRRPSPPPGRGVFFWLVILGGIMLLCVVACCGGFFLLLPDAKWREHESKRGGFKVELPDKPQPNIEQAAGLQLERNEHAEGTVLLKRAEHFVVLYRDMPSTKERLAKGGSDKTEMKKAIKELLDATAVKTRPREDPLTVGGFPACELEYQGRAGWYTARIVVANTRLYIIFAAGIEPPGSPDVRRFIESFTITDPALVAEGQKREEKAKEMKERGEKEAKEREEKQAEEREEKEAKENEAKEREEKRPKERKEPREKLPVAPPPRPIDD